MNGFPIPHFGLQRQHLKLQHEISHATEAALSSGCWVDGTFKKQLESWLKDKCKTRYAVLTHSGTQALEIIAKYYASTTCHASDPIYQPTCWVPNLTFPATMNAFINSGWAVDLVDVNESGLMNTSELTKLPKRNAVCLVGLYGAQPIFPEVDMPTPNPEYLCIVDGAQHWLVADGKVGDGMAISFDPTKNLPSSGNGGAIVTNNSKLCVFAQNYTKHGKLNGHHYSGSNSTMSEVECAHLLVRSAHIDDWQNRRKQIRMYWLDQFKSLPIRCLSEGHENHADQKFVIYSDNRDKLHKYMQENNVETRIHYEKVLSDLPMSTLKNNVLSKPDMLSIGMMLSKGVLSLPIYPELTDSEVEYIANLILKFHK